MNIIIGIFLYLGLTYNGDTITRAEIDANKDTIESLKNDPDFLEYYDQLLADPGITQLDINCNE